MMNKLISCILSITMILTSVLPGYAQALAQKPSSTPTSILSNYYPSFPEQSYLQDNALFQQSLYSSILEKARRSEAEILPLLELTQEKQENAEEEPLIDFEEFKAEYQKKLNEQEKEYIKKAKSAEEIRLMKDFFVKASQDAAAIQKSYQEAETSLQKDIEENPDKYHQLVYQELQPRVEVAVSLLGQSSVAEKVVPYLAAYNFLSDKQKQTAANIYRKRVIANQSFCGEISWWSGVKSVVGADGDIKEAQQKCTKAIEAASNLALVGANYDENTQDARALKDLLLSGYNGIVAPTVIQVTSQGLLALNAESLLASALLGIIRTPTIESLDVTLGMLSVETWVQVFQEASNVDNTFGSAIFAEGLEYSFYDNPEKGYSNKKNIWLDLARDLAEMADDPQEERNQQIKLALNSVMQDIVTYNSYGISIKFRPFVVGALLGGYEVEFPQPFEEEKVMDRYGKIHTVKPNTKAWKSVTEHIKSTGFTNSQYIAWFLYNTKKIDLDPATSQYMDNMLTSAFIYQGIKKGIEYEVETTGDVTTYTVAKYVKTGTPVTMQSRRHPPAELYESHEYRQDWKKVGRTVDVVLAVVGLVFIAKGIFSLAKFGVNGIKSGVRVLKLARAGQLATGSTYRASVSRVLSRARAISRTASYKAAVYESIANSIGLSRMKLDVPIQEIRTAKAAAVTPKTKPVKIDVRELNGELFMVPEGTETFYVNGQVVYANKGTSLSKVAKKYGVDRSLVRRAKNGTSWQPKAPETPRYYGTGEAVAGSTGSQPVYTPKPMNPVIPTPQAAPIVPATPVWTPKPVKKFEITPWKWYKANFLAGVDTFKSNLSSLFRFGARHPFKATGMALSSYGLGGVAPISLVPETAQVITVASPFTQPFRVFEAFQVAPKLASVAGTTSAVGTATATNTLAGTSRLWVNPFWAMFPPATSAHITPVGAISTLGTGGNSGGNRKNDWWRSAAAFDNYTNQLNNWLYTSNSLLRKQNPFFLQDRWTDFTTSLSLDWKEFNLKRNNNTYYQAYRDAQKGSSGIASYLPPFVVDLATKVKNNFSAYHNANKANREAKRILARKVPLLTDLRSILQSSASEEYKKEALLRIYTTSNLFEDVLSGLSRSSKKELRALQKGNDAAGVANFLFNLFKLGSFDQVLEHLNNNIPTDILAQELAELITSAEFNATSRAVYDDTPVLPAESNNFTGVVASLKDVDVEKLIAAARRNNWAAQNADSGKEVSGGWIYYENDIPVYYRNSKGKVSDSPVIILHQQAGNWWSSFLANLHLSTPKGIKVPKGMVLAMDENGRFKLVAKPGHRDELEDSKAARKNMDKIYEDGSKPVTLGLSSYTTTDLLAIANILEEGLPYNFDLTLDAPNSFKAFLYGIGVLSGLGIDNVMVGPFKNLVPSAPVVPNAFGGIGYVTPRIAGEMTPLMQKWGMSNSVFLVLSSILLTLGIAIPMGINGFVPVEQIFLPALIAPMVVLILTASLLRSSIPMLLNHYKDPRQRTAENLQVSTWQQGAKVGMALLAGSLPVVGGKFISVPIAAVATLLTLGFMMNTTLGKGVWGDFKNAWRNKQIFSSIKSGIGPVMQALKTGLYLGVAGPILDIKKGVSKWINKNKKVDGEESNSASEETLDEKAKQALQFQKEYEQDFATDPDTKASILRVTSAYASYAASLMLLNQVAEGPMGAWLGQALGTPGIGKWITAIFAGAAFIVRFFATKLISKGRFTDDQLTGISFAGLALMPLILAALPYEGLGWSVGVLLAGIFLNMSTAVPGQLDQTRLQNNVSAKILEQKNAVLADPNLTPAEKEAKIKELEQKESHWSAQASKAYSTANAKGIYGIYAAVLLSLLLPVFGVSNWDWIARGTFIYAGIAASVGAVKTLDMAASFLKSVFYNKKLVITEDDIAQKMVTPKTFGIKDANKATKIIPTLTKGKENSLKTLKEDLVPYDVVAISSEVKLTKTLKRMIEIHNRLVAAAELLGGAAVASAFEQLRDLAESYQKVLEKSNVSTSLRREFSKLLASLCVDGDVTKGVLTTPVYAPEGSFDIPEKYRNLLEARDLILELEVLARNIKQGGVAVTPDTYRNFINFHNKAVQMLLEYERQNLSEASIVRIERERIEKLCKALRKTKAIGQNSKTVSSQDIRDLNDLLKLY